MRVHGSKTILTRSSQSCETIRIWEPSTMPLTLIAPSRLSSLILEGLYITFFTRSISRPARAVMMDNVVVSVNMVN